MAREVVEEGEGGRVKDNRSLDRSVVINVAKIIMMDRKDVLQV